MLTAYFLILAVAVGVAPLSEASRPAVGVLLASWAVSFLSDVAGLRDMAPYIDLATFCGLVWLITARPSSGVVRAANFVALMVGAHFVFALTYRLGWHVPGLYMWTLNALYLAAVLSLIDNRPATCRQFRRLA